MSYVTAYRSALRHPFVWLTGQLLGFFAVSLYVKFAEVRLAAEYAPPWIGSGRFWMNCAHVLLFSGQEVGLFATLLVLVGVWRRCDPAGGRVSRWAAWGIGCAVLPVLSLVEVLGLAHFALFLTPIGPEQVRLLAWSSHIVATNNVLPSPPVRDGLMLALTGYAVAPALVWFAAVRRGRRRSVAAAVALAGAILVAVAPKPPVADALLAPHPVLWLLFGNRPQRIWEGTPGIAATDPQMVRGHARFAVKDHPKNVLLFVLESTRAASVALYNPKAAAGRELAALQDEVVVFDHVYAPVPTSAHAIFSMLYGVYPYLGPFWTSAGKSVAADSLAQVLGRAGYARQFYVTGDLDYDQIRTFAARGFERVLDINEWPGQEAYAEVPWGRDDRLLLDEIKRFLSTRDERPFFLYAMTSNPHYPYAVDHLPGGAVADPHKAYDRAVTYGLGLVAELYQWMKQRGLAEQTLLMVVGDHGEAFGEHAGNFGHAAFIYEENVHVPCFILHPRRLGLPHHIAQLGSQVDLRATILDVLGRPDSEPGDGMSLLREDPNRLVVNFTENGVSHFGMRDARFTYIYTPHVATEQLFDRGRDPRETRDLVASEPAVTARYRGDLHEWEAQHDLVLSRILR